MGVRDLNPRFLKPETPRKYMWEFPKIRGTLGFFRGILREFPTIRGTLFGVLVIRVLLLRVLYKGPLFSETPM